MFLCRGVTVRKFIGGNSVSVFLDRCIIRSLVSGLLIFKSVFNSLFFLTKS